MFSPIPEHLRKAKRLLRAPVSRLAKDFSWLYRDCNNAWQPFVIACRATYPKCGAPELLPESVGKFSVNLLGSTSGLSCEQCCGVSCVTANWSQACKCWPVHNAGIHSSSFSVALNLTVSSGVNAYTNASLWLCKGAGHHCNNGHFKAHQHGLKHRSANTSQRIYASPERQTAHAPMRIVNACMP